MSHILIDGYNLIGTAHGNLEKVRNDLISRLYEYSKIKGHQVTLVFDGWKDGQKDETKTRSGNLTVIYSRLGDTADHVIRKMISSSAAQWIVVSSDREVSDFAINKDFAAVTSDEFEIRMNRALHAGEEEFIDQDFEEDLMDCMYSPSKGNPGKLSKKQKRKLSALKKL